MGTRRPPHHDPLVARCIPLPSFHIELRRSMSHRAQAQCYPGAATISLSLTMLLGLLFITGKGFQIVPIRGGMSRGATPVSQPWGAPPVARRSSQHRRGSALLAMKQKFDARQDYYMKLGLTEEASVNDIKRAYRRLALKTHPDVNKAPDAAEQFKRVCEAYKVLSDPESRKQYDLARKYRDPSSYTRTGGAGTGGGGGGGGRQWSDTAYDPSTGWGRKPEETADSIDDSFSKIFSDFLGTVSSRGGRGIFEDVVDFLEDQVDGFSEDSSDEFEELLRSDSLSEIQEEVENLNFLIKKLREKLHKSQLDRMMAEADVRNFTPDPRDMDALEKRMERVEREAGLRARCTDLEGHIKRADKRQRRLMLRAEELRWGPGGTRPAYAKYSYAKGTAGSASSRTNTAGSSTSSGSSSSSSSSSSSGRTSSSTSSSSSSGAYSSSSSSNPKRSDAVEEELKRLKREMGIGGGD